MSITTQHDSQTTVLDQLVQHVYITNLSIGWPRLRLTIRDAVVEVGNGEVVSEKLRTNPKWDLLPGKWRKLFQSIDSKARTVLAKQSIRFTTPAMAMLPITSAEQVFEKLSELRTAFFDAADDFSAEFHDIRAGLFDRISLEVGRHVASAVFAKIPKTAEHIRNRFYFTWAIIPIGYNNLSERNTQRLLVARAAAIQTGQHDIAEQLDQVLSSVSKALRDVAVSEARELTQAARKQMETYAERLVHTITDEPRRQLIEAASHLREAMASGKFIKNGSLERVREAVQLINSFQFLQDDQLLREAQRLDTYLAGHDASSINHADDNLQEALSAVIDATVAVANDAASAAQAKRRFMQLTIE